MNDYEAHIREIDALREQCDKCRLYKKDNKHGGCEVRWKLVNQDNKVAWEKKHLFLTSNGICKMFKEKK